jgi:hypothetical protein
MKDMGILSNHPLRMESATDQRTCFGRSAAPTPIREVVTTWVVEVGAPMREDQRMTAAALI